VSIVPRSSGALGFAQYLPQEMSLFSKEARMGQFSKISLVEISNSWYPLVNKHFANWKITMLFLWVNPRTFDWAIFNS
jgi:hypothetical protein